MLSSQGRTLGHVSLYLLLWRHILALGQTFSIVNLITGSGSSIRLGHGLLPSLSLPLIKVLTRINLLPFDPTKQVIEA